jgi:outer membrane protein
MSSKNSSCGVGLFRAVVMLGAMVWTWVAMPQAADAQGYGSSSKGGSNFHWAGALGVGFRPDYEGSDHYETIPIGGAKMWWDDGRYSELSGTESSGSAIRLSGNLIPNSPIELGPVMQYRLGRGDVQSGRVDKLNNVDGAFETGALAAYRMKPWSVEMSYVYDISDGHGGSLIEFAGGYTETLSDNLDVGVTVASTWASGAYMGTYFNVSPTEAAETGFAAYDADDGFKDVGVRVKLGWQGDGWDGWKIIGSFAYFRMLGDAEDSPIVDTAGAEDQFFGGLALGYQR